MGGGRLGRARKSLRRIGEVLLVSTYMVTLWFPIRIEPQWLLRLDILPCIGLSLLCALPLFAVLAARPWILAAVSGAIGFVVLLTTPLVWAGATGLAGQLLTNNPSPTSSPFPLFPWAGYVFLGGALGAIAARAKRWQLAVAVLGLAALGAAAWSGSDALMARAPSWRWWVPANHSQRVVVVSALILAMLALERLLPEAIKKGRVVGFFEVFGMSSLAAYFGHEVMLYKNIFGICFNTLWGKSAGWALYAILTGALIALTFAFTWSAAYVYDHGREWLVKGWRRLRPEPRLEQPEP
jgi:uncharacterized membrane protein